MQCLMLGYGNTSPEEILQVLSLAEIDLVVDVRSVPFSRRRPEMSRPSLERLLPQHGISYLYLGEGLGGKPDGLQQRVVYFGNTTCGVVPLSERPAYRRDLERLISLLSRHRVMLLCRCAVPERCHRARLIGVSLVQRGIRVWHIDLHRYLSKRSLIQNRIDLLRHAAVDGRLFAQQLFSQGDLFGGSVIGQAL